MASQTIDEIFASAYFINSVKEELFKIKQHRTNLIHNSKKNVRLRSDAFSTLSNLGMLYPEQLSDEYKLIYVKKSVLPSRERSWIVSFIGAIICRCVLHGNKLEKVKDEN